MKLKDLYIFEGLSNDELSYFSLMTESKEYKTGEIIIKEGDESNSVAYIIESGEVDVFIKGEKISTLGNGDLFGEIALITNEPRTASVKVKSPSKIISIYKEDFIMLCERSGKYEEIKQKILKRIKDNFYGIKG